MINSNYLIAVVIVLLIAVLISIWKINWVKSVLSYISQDKMPIWLSILLAVSAGMGTYYIAPLINESFEFQKNRSTHLISTIEELNKGVVELSVSVRKFDDALFYGRDSKGEMRGAALDKIAELQWRLVDAEVIINRVYPGDKTTTTLSSELMVLQNTIINAKKPEDQENVAVAQVRVVAAAKQCMITLYRAANIN
jgi:hypothetical protein